MTVGEMIVETRKLNGLTQEQYGERFGVTRQTVSSWENEKSFPDLQTLITICDTYDMSLDGLLREDRKMVKKVDNATKMAKYIRIGIMILAVVVVIYAIVALFWFNASRKADKEFSAAMKEFSFEQKNENSPYVVEINGAKYIVPNQEYAFMVFHYNAQFLDIEQEMKVDDSISIRIADVDWISLTPNGNLGMTFELTKDGTLKNEEKMSEKQLGFYKKYEAEIFEMVTTGSSIYTKVYK